MCTGIRFTDAAGGMYLGRNLDWTAGYGEQVVAVPASARVPAAFERPGDLPAGAGHAVVGTAVVAGGLPLYFDCGNDAGLAVAGLNFPQSARYADAPVEGKANVAAYEFPFWVARNFSSVDEVRAALADAVVVARPAAAHLPVARLHWLVGDATGSIVVECLEQGLRVWDNDADVLTNEPDFGWQRQNLRNYLALTERDPGDAAWGRAGLSPFGTGTGMQGIPGDFGGPARFVRAAFANSRYPVQEGERANVVRMFRTLGAVAVPTGCVRTAGGELERTLYSSCFSAPSLTYYRLGCDDLRVRAYPLAACPAVAEGPVALAPGETGMM